MTEECQVVIDVVTEYESSTLRVVAELEPLVQVGEREILNYLGHDSLSRGS